MRRWYAMVALGCLTGCSGGDRWDDALARMKRQPRYDPYEASAMLPGGAAMQPPPAGTVPRERVLEAERRPPTITPELLAAGRHRFRIFCGACHGAGGYGGSLVAANLPKRPPPSLRRPELRAFPDTYFYQVITTGLGRMPSYAAELRPRERWAVVAYLRLLQSRDTAAADEREDSTRAARLHEAGR